MTLKADGFTIVEIMVTVAVLGILAVIAIPSYSKYQRRARQAEAKVVLSGGFIGEHTLKNADYGGSYSACIGAIGGGAEGNSYYTFGFGDVAATTNFTCLPFGRPAAKGVSPENANSCLAYSWSRTAGPPVTYTISATCQAVEGGTFFTAKDSRPDGAAIPSPSDLNVGSQILNQDQFELVSAGRIGGANIDVWTVNQDKLIYQLADGVSDN